MSIQYKFGTYDFTDTIEESRTRDNIIIDAASVPRRHGQVIQGGKVGVREYELNGRLFGSTAENLRSLRDNLRAGIFHRTENLTIFSDRFVEARLLSYADNYVDGAAMEAMDFSLVFQSTLPFEQSVELQSETTVTTTSTNTDFNITNDGNFEAFAKITITAPGSSISNNLTFTNLTRDEEFSFLGTILATKSLIVDYRVLPPTVTNNLVDDIDNYSGDFPKLSAGINNMRVVTSVGTSITIEWRHTYV